MAINYILNWTDDTLKTPITILDEAENTETSITLYGYGKQMWAEKMQENILHIMENFAAPTPPLNPTEGQLWYDTTTKTIKVWNGLGIWNTTGVNASDTEPTSLTVGQMWYDTLNDVLKVWDGSLWQILATRAYVDAKIEEAIQGLDIKQSVRAATTGNIILSGLQTIDDIVLIDGDRVLVKNQTTQTENGIYSVSAGAWTRTIDADNTPGSEVTSGMYVFVDSGTINIGSGWVLTTPNPIVLGTSNLIFVQFSGAGQIIAGDGMTKIGNTLNVVGTAGRIIANGDSLDLATTGVTAGTYRSLTVDIYGRITLGSNPTTLSGYGITDAVNKSGDTMTGPLTTTTLTTNAGVLGSNGNGQRYVSINLPSGGSDGDIWIQI